MEEVLVWVMGGDGGTRVLIGSFGTNGVIYRCMWVDDPSKIASGTYRTRDPKQSALDVYGITRRAESSGYGLALEPTVLRVPAPPLSGNLEDWVEAEVWPVVEARMAVLL